MPPSMKWQKCSRNIFEAKKKTIRVSFDTDRMTRKTKEKNDEKHERKEWSYDGNGRTKTHTKKKTVCKIAWMTIINWVRPLSTHEPIPSVTVTTTMFRFHSDRMWAMSWPWCVLDQTNFIEMSRPVLAVGVTVFPAQFFGWPPSFDRHPARTIIYRRFASTRNESWIKVIFLLEIKKCRSCILQLRTEQTDRTETPNATLLAWMARMAWLSGTELAARFGILEANY